MPPEDSPVRRRLEATVTGRVQGVGFRYFVLTAASGLGLDGWVMNGRDGSVRLAAEGDDRALEDLLARVRRGPAGARVDHVAVAWQPLAGEAGGFRVRSGEHSGD